MTQNKAISQTLYDLYVVANQKYLYQNKKGIYSTREVGVRNTKNELSPMLLDKHLNGQATYGVFASQFTKFVCFDVDCLEHSQTVATDLIDVLVEVYGIERKHIHVSFSGSKGYHVEIFFTEPVETAICVDFYKDVIQTLVERGTPVRSDNGELDLSKKVEFRPTATQGVKLPLGVHQVTKKRCWFVDENFGIIGRERYIEEIEPMDAELFLDVMGLILQEKPNNALTKEQKYTFAGETQTMNFEGVTESDSRSYALEMFKIGQLVEKGTRNNVTRYIATLLWEQGYEKEEATDMLLGFMDNTPSEMFNDCNREFIEKETIRLVDNQYKYEYKFQADTKPVFLYKEQLEQILSSTSKVGLRKTCYAILVHATRHADETGKFYMSYVSFSKMMGAEQNRPRVMKAIRELEELGLIEVVEHGVLDAVRTKRLKRTTYKPNVYRIKISLEGQKKNSFQLTTLEPPSLYEIMAELFSEEEAKKKVPKKTFYREVKHLYGA